MPIINGRYYANPSFGRALEEAREAGKQHSAEDARGDADDTGRSARDAGEHARDSAGDDPALRGRAVGAVHHIHITREPRGIVVHMHRHDATSDDAEPEPHGTWSTHTFDHNDHNAAGEFVKRHLARRG